MVSQGYEVLNKYLPEGSLDLVAAMLNDHSVHVKIKAARKSKFGDYRPLKNSRFAHQISINNDLNPFAFLITMIHEIAHMRAHEKFGHLRGKNRVMPHGIEWKNIYAKLLEPFILNNIFPKDIQFCLIRHLEDVTASSCTDIRLYKKLKEYDPIDLSVIHLENLAEGTLFKWRNGMVFRKEARLRKRFRCIETRSHKIYLFHPLAEVEPV